MFRKNLYIKDNLSPYKISRTKIDLFFDCHRCFYIDQRLGIKRPHGAALVINNNIVNKFKKNLDILRKTQTIIPETTALIPEIGLKPLMHDKINLWINTFTGIQSFHKKTNIKITANIDDVWKSDTECYPVIIKSISRPDEDVEGSVWPGYTRQLSLYSYLLKHNGLQTGDSGIIVMINTSNDKNYSRLEFKYFLYKKL